VGRPREHDAETRKLLFQAAETLLSRGGAEALSVRGVAHAAGTTTRAVYSTFGSKQGLYAALYRESWQALCRAIDALPPIEDPLEALVEAGASGFRSYALEHPNLFRLVFERLVPDIRPGPEDLAASEAALARLSECVQRCADGFGEPDGTKSERARRIAEALIAAGFRCPVTPRFRHEIWVKLLGNVAFNPISALTRATLEEMARHPDVSRLVRELMVETEAVAARLGIELPISIDQRMAGAEKVGAHKTSMLQDLEARTHELAPARRGAAP
jgi:AcrR family transcriptional regulator